MDSNLINRSSENPMLVVGASGMDMVGRLINILPEGAIQTVKSNPATIRTSYGGVARNVAENLARLGQRVRLISAVGNDLMGEQLLQYTAASGVDVSCCLVSDQQSTSAYLAVLSPEGGRYMVLEDMSVLDEVTPSFLKQHKEIIGQSSLAFVDANLSPKTLKSLITSAYRCKVPVCADAASPLLARRLLPFLDKISILSANAAEASALCDNMVNICDRNSALQVARELVNQGVELAIIAMAELGVVYATSETSGYVPAVQTQVLDSTGAGDALIATVIFGILNQIPIDESVRLGVTAASLILHYRGTVFPGLSLERLYDELIA